ncbi:thiolase family protein [Nocardia rhamnosiphila]|uniref:Thiolase family protein n=1 Tax=Nocardia rhamnosiphila TaxID=426716 RepID=A0ABV2X270_9NOCA
MSVIVAGVGVTRFGKLPERSVESLAVEAVRTALRDAGIGSNEVDLAYSSSLFQPPGHGQRYLKHVGLAGVPIVNVENACASSSTGILQAASMIEVGAAEVVLCVGAESHTSPGVLPKPDQSVFGRMGMSWPAKYALEARAEIENGHVSADQLARIAVKNRLNASLNPNAQFQQRITVEEVLASRMVSDPLTLLQCCPQSDGAAAVVLTSSTHRAAHASGRRPVTLAGSAIRSGALIDRGKPQPQHNVTRRASHAAYEIASVAPEDLDVCEVHDAFTIGEYEHYESLGLCAPGQAGMLIETGATELSTPGVVVSPGGGLLSRGHPIGATGAAQMAEIVTQLRGEAGDRQVDHARVGLTHTMGGTDYQLESNVCVVHILTT